MANAFPSATNVYIPSDAKNAEITADLIANYSRNPKKFLINKIAQIIPVKKQLGYFKRVLPENRARVTDASGTDRIWNPGGDRPTNPGNKLPFTNVQYETKRFAESTVFSYEEIELASFDVKADHLQMLAQQIMTQRTVIGLTTLTTTSNYPSSHTGTATALSGGLWSAGTYSNRYIQKTLMAARNQIIKSTVGMDGSEELSLLVNPTLAQAMAASEEIMWYLGQQANSQNVIEFKGTSGTFGLPSNLYGFRVLVDHTVKSTSNPSVTDVSSSNAYVLSDSTATIFYQPGDLVGDLMKGINSTLVFFTREEMNIETRDDNWNRRIEFSCVDEYDCKVAADRTGFIVTSCIS